MMTPTEQLALARESLLSILTERAAYLDMSAALAELFGHARRPSDYAPCRTDPQTRVTAPRSPF